MGEYDHRTRSSTNLVLDFSSSTSKDPGISATKLQRCRTSGRNRRLLVVGMDVDFILGVCSYLQSHSFAQLDIDRSRHGSDSFSGYVNLDGLALKPVAGGRGKASDAGG